MAAGILLVAGITQGALGFGFPAIATPLLVLITDVKTAIILNLLPNFAVNVISTFSGGNWSASLGRYWPVAAWVLVGSWIGANFIIHAPSEPVRILLALAIFAYLCQQWLARLDWRWLVQRMGPDLPLLHGLLAVFNWMCPRRARAIPAWLRQQFALPDIAADDPDADEQRRAALFESRPWFALHQPAERPLER